MANSKNRLLLASIALLYSCLQTRTAWSETAKKDIIGFLTTDPRLKKAKQWAEDSGILQEIDFSMYGGKITLVLPSNNAFEEFERDHPTWKAKLVSDSSDIETVSFVLYPIMSSKGTEYPFAMSFSIGLLLFASTDHRISVADVKKGVYEEPESIISILSEYSSISKEGKLCVAGHTRAVPCNHPERLPCCAHIDLDQPIVTTSGNIYLVDKVLLPQDLIDKLQEE